MILNSASVISSVNNGCGNGSYCSNMENINQGDMVLTSKQLVGMSVLSGIEGSWGPLSWALIPEIDSQNILNSNFKITIKLLGVTILNTDINKDNSHVLLNVGILKGELGIDYNTSPRRVYLRGYLNYIVDQVKFDITLVNF